jgi:hypothetical protein
MTITITPEQLPTDPAVGWFDFTPEVSREILETVNEGNRSIRDANVQAFGRDMANGEWTLNGEAIQFSKSGKLLNGQNRLTASARYNVPFRNLVVTGLAEDASDSIDTGAGRTTNDLFVMKGVDNPSDVAALVKIGQLYEEGFVQTAELNRRGGGSVRRTHAEDWEFYTSHPDINASVALFRSHAKSLGLSKGAILYAGMRFRAITEDGAKLFMDSLAEHQSEGPGDPRSTLLKYVAKRRSELRGTSPRGPESLWVLFRTWNAFRANESLTVLRPGYQNSKIPVPA